MIIFQEHDSGEAKGQTTSNHRANVNLTFFVVHLPLQGYGSDRGQSKQTSAPWQGVNQLGYGAYGGYGLTSLTMFNHQTRQGISADDLRIAAYCIHYPENLRYTLQ